MTATSEPGTPDDWEDTAPVRFSGSSKVEATFHPGTGPSLQSQRKKLASLRRRRNHLQGLLDRGESTLSWDAAEASALTWAIQFIERHRPDLAEGD